MSYICEFCGLRPENCGCSIESELENHVVQRPYGLIDAPSPSAFFSLLVEMESETNCDSTPIITNNLLPIPKLERQSNRPSEQDLEKIARNLFPEEPLIFDDDLSEFEIKNCRDFPDEDPLVKCPTSEEMIYTDNEHGICFDIEQKLYPDDIPMELRYNN
jgi:hypothetical protein